MDLDTTIPLRINFFKENLEHKFKEANIYTSMIRIGGMSMNSLHRLENIKDNMKNVYRYQLRILPEAQRLHKELSALTADCSGGRGAKRGYEEPQFRELDLKSACIFALSQKAFSKDTLGFITTLHHLCCFLDRVAEKDKPDDLAVIRRLYQPLSDAVDPDRISAGCCEYFDGSKAATCLKSLTEACQGYICRLPSHKLVTGKMKKFAHLHIELQACRNQPVKTRSEHLVMWSEYYMRQFPDIAFWEFSAAADSLLGIYAMFTAASDPGLTENDVRELEQAYFPWICGLQKLFYHYIASREDMMMGHLNFTSYYKNLRHCEERLAYFMKKSLEYSGLPAGHGIHSKVVKTMPALYLSDPGASFGLNRIASRNIMAESPPETKLFWNCGKFIGNLK